MRDLSDALKLSQKAMGDALCKVVLSKGGQSDETFGVDTTNRILDLKHPQSEYSQTAQIVVDNREGNLTALALEGWKGIISYGYVATYSATAPLTVIAQKTDTMQGDLLTTLSLAGLFNMWGEQKATEAYSPDEINTDTVKTILDAIASHSMTCFGSYPVHTITYDTGYDDGIINVFKPADAFSVAKGESRLSAFKKAMAYLKCKCRVQNDSSVATIHIYFPILTGDTWVASTAYILNDYVQPTTPNNNFTYKCTTAGTSHSNEPTWPTTAGGTVTEGGGSTLVWTAVDFDYEYNTAEGVTYHNFFSKSARKRLVLPNRVVVMNHPDHSDSYTGNAVDAASYAALGNQYYTETIYCRPASNAQCTLIAKAVLLRYQLAAERGYGHAPMNCGQEYCDYVKITDAWASDFRIGNIGYLCPHYTPGTFEFEFRFGTLEMLGLAGTVPPAQTTIASPTTQESLVETVAALIETVNNLIGDYNTLRESLLETIATANSIIDYLVNRQWEGEFSKLSVTLRFQGPTGTDMWA